MSLLQLLKINLTLCFLFITNINSVNAQSINNSDNKVNDSICIFSPDADVILLALLANKYSDCYIFRDDQQKTEVYYKERDYLVSPSVRIFNLINYFILFDHSKYY